MRALGRARSARALIVLFVALAAIYPIDEAVHDPVFRYVVSHEVRLLANGFTLLGTTASGMGLLGVLAVVGHRTGDGVLWRASLGGLAGVALGGVATQALKHAACRARPKLVDGWGVGSTAPKTISAEARGFFHWPCFSEGRYHSFPSGHAATAFAVAAALTAIVPARRRAWFAVAAGVGASRVLLNAHFVSDVVGGGLIGWWATQGGQWLAARFAPRVGAPPPASITAETDEPAGTPLA